MTAMPPLTGCALDAALDDDDAGTAVGALVGATVGAVVGAGATDEADDDDATLELDETELDATDDDTAAALLDELAGTGV